MQICFDNRECMRLIVNHLIEHHNYTELMVNRNKRPQVIAVSNDEMAIEVFYCLNQMGIRYHSELL